MIGARLIHAQLQAKRTTDFATAAASREHELIVA